MARSLLGIQTPASVTSLPATDTRSTRALVGPALHARLRQKRSAAYLEAMAQLDAGGHVHRAAATQALVDAIRKELPEVSVDALPHGIVARCYLGPPHEVHTLDCGGHIIRHYKSHESLPAPLERARSLAQHPGYAFIEVYTNRLIAVSASGQTALIDL